MVLLGHHGGLIVVMVRGLLTMALVGGMIDLVMLAHPGMLYFLCLTTAEYFCDGNVCVIQQQSL